MAIYLLVVSIIIPVALVSEPAFIPGPSDDGMFKLILNISSPSTMLSSVTATLTVVLVALAGIVALRGVVLKSLPVRRYHNMNVMKLATKLFAVSSEKLISIEIILFMIPPVIITVTDILLSFSFPLKFSDVN